MTLKIGNDIYEISSADNCIYFNSEENNNRLTIILRNSSIDIESFSDLKNSGQSMVLTTEETETIFNDFKLESVRKTYGDSISIILDFIKTN